MPKKSFKEFYSEFDEVNEDEYHYVTMEQLRQIFTEEEINQHFKDGSIVDESEMVNEFFGMKSALPKFINKAKGAVKSAAQKVKGGATKLRVVSKAMRKKIGLRMKRLAKTSAFKTKVARSKLKIASPAKILVKAKKLAKQKVLDKFYPKYKEMSLAARVKIDQTLATRYGGMIQKQAKKQEKVVKKKELEKVKKAREGKPTTFAAFMKDKRGEDR